MTTLLVTQQRYGSSEFWGSEFPGQDGGLRVCNESMYTPERTRLSTGGSDQGPQTLDQITDALMQSGLGVGSRGSVRNVILFTLRGSDRFASRYDKDHTKRWRLKLVKPVNAPDSLDVTPEPLSKAATMYALARMIAEEMVRSLTSRPSDDLHALLLDKVSRLAAVNRPETPQK